MSTLKNFTRDENVSQEIIFQSITKFSSELKDDAQFKKAQRCKESEFMDSIEANSNLYKKYSNNPITEYAAQLKENTSFFQNMYYRTTVLKSAIIEKGKSLLVMYEITKKEGIATRWGIMKITFEYEKFVHEIVPNYNGTLEHYWLLDVENHFKSIVEGGKWSPLYDSQGREFKGDYMPL